MFPEKIKSLFIYLFYNFKLCEYAVKLISDFKIVILPNTVNFLVVIFIYFLNVYSVNL